MTALQYIKLEISAMIDVLSGRSIADIISSDPGDTDYTNKNVDWKALKNKVNSAASVAAIKKAIDEAKLEEGAGTLKALADGTAIYKDGWTNQPLPGMPAGFGPGSGASPTPAANTNPDNQYDDVVGTPTTTSKAEALAAKLRQLYGTSTISVQAKRYYLEGATNADVVNRAQSDYNRIADAYLEAGGSVSKSDAKRWLEWKYSSGASWTSIGDQIANELSASAGENPDNSVPLGGDAASMLDAKFREVFGGKPSDAAMNDLLAKADKDGVSSALNLITARGSAINGMIGEASGRYPRPGEAREWYEKVVANPSDELKWGDSLRSAIFESFDGDTPPPLPPTGGGSGGGDVAESEAPQQVDYTDYIKKVVKGYTGRDATAGDIAHWNGMFQSGQATPHDMLLEVVDSKEAKDHRAAVLNNDQGEFDAVVDRVFMDYLGHGADEASKDIHGAALKGGMSLDDFREMVKTTPGALQSLTDGQYIDQNNIMTNAVQVADANGTYVPSMFDHIVGQEPEGTFPENPQPSTPSSTEGGGSSAPVPDSAPTPTPVQTSLNDTEFIKKAVLAYTGRDATEGDLKHWTGMFAQGASRQDLLKEVVRGRESQEFLASAGNSGGFDAVVVQIWQDYTGSKPDETSLRIHSAALKNGMSLDDFREMVLSSPAAQNYLAGTGGLTSGQITDQNSIMSNAVSAANFQNDYGPAEYIKGVYRSYLGREATPDQIQKWGEAMAGGMSRNQVLVKVSTSDEAEAFQNRVLSGGNGFENVVREVWQDYTGTQPDETSLRIHSAALKNGMSLDDFRKYMKTSSFVQEYIRRDSVTGDELAEQDEIMARALAAAANVLEDPQPTPAPVPSAPPAPEVPPAPVDAAGVIDTDQDRAAKAQMDALWSQYVGRPADAGDFAAHGQALVSGAKSWETMRNEVANSGEAAAYRTNVINDTFRSVVGREPTQEDMNIWQGRLAGGESIQSFQSAAAANAAADRQANAEAWVNQMYQNYLGRPVDQWGKENYAVQVANGRSKESVQQEIAGSAEAKVVSYYSSYLDRAPSEWERQNYANKINSSGPEAARQEIASSNEAYVVRTLQNYYNQDHPPRGRVEELCRRLESGATRQDVLIDIVNDDPAQNLQNSYVANGQAYNNVVDQLFAQNGHQVDDASRKIHGSALSGGMSQNDLNDYLKNAAHGGVVSFTDPK